MQQENRFLRLSEKSAVKKRGEHKKKKAAHEISVRAGGRDRQSPGLYVKLTKD